MFGSTRHEDCNIQGTVMWPQRCLLWCSVDMPHPESRVEWRLSCDKNKFDLLCSHFLLITVIFLCSVTSGY
jgi:hypothetical protein